MTTLHLTLDDYLLPDSETINEFFTDDFSHELDVPPAGISDEFDWKQAIH